MIEGLELLCKRADALKPLSAALLVGTVWGLWHVPRDVVSGVIGRLGGSILPAIAVHGLSNDALGIAGAVTIEQALTPYHQITKAIPICLLAVLLVLLDGRRPVPGGRAGSG